MKRLIGLAVGLCAAALAASPAPTPAPSLDEAFTDLYNFDFPATNRVLQDYIALHPEEAMPYAVRAAGYLFFELDRLGILESEFLIDDKRIANKKVTAARAGPGHPRAIDESAGRCPGARQRGAGARSQRSRRRCWRW